MGGQQLRMIRSGRWKLHVRAPTPGFRCLEDASGWKDRRGPDGVTIIAQFEQANPTQCPGVQTGPAPAPILLFDMLADRSEQRDVADRNPEVVDRLRALFNHIDAQAPREYPEVSRSAELLRLQGGELRYDRLIEPLAP